MHVTLNEKKKDVQDQTVECEKYNNQDQYTKYAKMQRSLVKMQKLIKTNETEIHERFQGLKLSDREKFELLIQGKEIDDIVVERKSLRQQTVQDKTPVKPESKSFINFEWVVSILWFYTLFYLIPLVIIPIYVGDRYDYLTYTGL